MAKRTLRTAVMILGCGLWGGAVYLLAAASDLDRRIYSFPEYKQPTSDRSTPLSVKGRSYFVSAMDARLYSLLVPIGVPARMLLGLGCAVLLRRGRGDVLGQ